MILNRDLIKPLLRVAQSLWGDTKLSLDVSVDTIATIQLLRLEGNPFLYRTLRALIDRHERGNEPTDSEYLNRSLYRIHPLERALLVLTYEFNWTAEMLAQALELNSDELDALLWKAKLDILTHRVGGKLLAIPTPSKLGPQCPEWNGSRPWSARYLEHRLSRADQIFIHGHVDQCTVCRPLLEQTRSLFQDARATYDSSMPAEPSDSDLGQMMKILSQGETYAFKRTMPLGESFRYFLQKNKSMQLLLVAFIGWLIWKYTH